MHLQLPGQHEERIRSLGRHLSLRPPTATPTAMAAQVQVQFFAGAVLAVVLSALPGQQPALVVALLISAVLALVLALEVRSRGRLPGPALHAILVFGSLVVSAAALVATDEGASIAFTFCYAIMVVVAIASSSWRGVALHVALALTGLTVQHLWRGVGNLTTVIIIGFVMVLMAIFTGRILRAAADAEIDVLTRLPNRRGFERAVGSALSEMRTANGSEATPVSVVLVDVDHFEVINRTRGHAAGDDTLQSIARTLNRLSSVTAVPAHLDADRFALLLREGDSDAAVALANTVRAALDPVEVSVGIAQLDPEQDGGALLRRAETALREAKAAGRNCVRVAEAEDETLVRALRSALAGARIQVALQPLVAPVGQQIVGVEALARWYHPPRGWVSPAVFIPLAEKHGLIPDLGRVVLQRACADVHRLVEHLGHPVTLTVNASGGELVRQQYAQQVADVLHAERWPAQHLVIEVTESSLDAASRATLATVAGLRELGVQIAIDDFGTGYSAFSQLDAIPAEYLKLDTTFTATTTTSVRRRSMLAALVNLCGDLGIKVIAEGVETVEQAQLVADYGCDLAQGYHYAKPLAVDDLIITLAASAVLQPAAPSKDFHGPVGHSDETMRLD